MLFECGFYILLFIFISLLFVMYQLFPRVDKSYIQCETDKQQIQMGKQFWSTKRVVVCGLIRDGMGRFPKVRRQIEELLTSVNEYTILIVENDSKDGTRDYLLEWTDKNDNVKILGCGGINLKECKLKMKKTDNHGFDMYRIQKMATLRNVYMEELQKEKYDNIDYILVWDMDLDGEMDINGFYQTGFELSKQPTIDAICVNGIIENFARIRSYAYYDTYAYRKHGDRFGKKVFYDLMYRYPAKCDSELQQVRSCFGGLVVYNFNTFRNKKYGTELNMYNEPICEHDYLNRELSEVYVNPKWLYLLAEH